MTEAAGYIVFARDTGGWPVYGAGITAEAAWDQVVDGVQSFRDAEGEDILPDDARESQFVTMRATQALIDRIEADGGQVMVGEIAGIACTEEEESEAKVVSPPDYRDYVGRPGAYAGEYLKYLQNQEEI